MIRIRSTWLLWRAYRKRLRAQNVIDRSMELARSLHAEADDLEAKAALLAMRSRL